MARMVGNAGIAGSGDAPGDHDSRRSGLRSAMGAAAATVTALGVVAALAGTADAAAAVNATAVQQAPQRIGTAPQLPQGATRTGTAASGTLLHLAVNLQPRDPAALSTFVAQVSDKGSPLYHRYLAPASSRRSSGRPRAPSTASSRPCATRA
ncbi:hypothetical protein GXW82_32330 [Streptacidiphilus sp. 4-A2]|nr:hypothetical protein [Streptacidiphilus sp. 4-A2]